MKIRIKKNIWLKYLMIFISALLYTIGIQGFLQVGKTFSNGLGAFASLFTFIWENALPYFSLIYLVLNIPLILIFWKFNSRSFMKRTIFFLLVQSILGSVFLIEDSHKWIDTSLIMGDPNLTIQEKEWPILILALIGAIFVGVSTGIAWKNGSSTGGTDFIAYYFSHKRKMNLASTMFALSTIVLTFSATITIIFQKTIQQHWIMTTLATVLYVLLSINIVNMIYPKYKKIEITIISLKWKDISDHFKKNHYHHSWQIHPFISGHLGHSKTRITTIIFLLELKHLKKILHKIDSKAWLSISPVQRIYGNFNDTKLEN